MGGRSEVAAGRSVRLGRREGWTHTLDEIRSHYRVFRQRDDGMGFIF